MLLSDFTSPESDDFGDNIDKIIIQYKLKIHNRNICVMHLPKGKHLLESVLNFQQTTPLPFWLKCCKICEFFEILGVLHKKIKKISAIHGWFENG